MDDLNRGKSSPKMWLLLYLIFQKTAQIPSVGENSPNLVTLIIGLIFATMVATWQMVYSSQIWKSNLPN
jgi:hypothetical protein